MKLVATLTPDGLVVRRVYSTREDAWRHRPDGSWDHAFGHNGPWIATNAIYVPREVLRVCAEAAGGGTWAEAAPAADCLAALWACLSCHHKFPIGKAKLRAPDSLIAAHSLYCPNCHGGDITPAGGEAVSIEAYYGDKGTLQ